MLPWLVARLGLFGGGSMLPGAGKNNRSWPRSGVGGTDEMEDG